MTLDGSTTTLQEKLVKEHVASEIYQAVYIPLGSCMISLLVLDASGRITHMIGFALWRPAFVWVSMTLSVAALSDQWFVYSQAKEAGALIFAATMSITHVRSISYAKHGASDTLLQPFGPWLAFAAFLL